MWYGRAYDGRMCIAGGYKDSMSAKPKKRRKKKYRKRRRQRAGVPGIWKLLLIVMLLAAGGAGYEYYKTGSIEKTRETAQKLAVWCSGLPDKVQKLWTEAEKELRELLAEKDAIPNVSTLTEIPRYNGEDYVTVNGNEPVFSQEQRNAEPYEFYSDLDWLGRCGYAEAKISVGLMPTEERGAIGEVKPSGWHTVKYDCIEDMYLYNRCHLIGYQLTGENANERNLITGTRYLNVNGMLPWENQVADYIRTTGDMVLYRVTPLYEGDNLVASGVQMEAQSLGSDKIRFNIFVFNVQPGICIDYASGESWEETGE